MNEPIKKRWAALTNDEKQYLEDFIVHNIMDHVEELEELGFAAQELRDGHWFVTEEGLECYEDRKNGDT